MASGVVRPARKALLAIDVGGSTTRAHLVAPDGESLGHGRDRGGNPASNNPDFAAASVISAVEAAVQQAGGGPLEIEVAQIALAGPQAHVAVGRLEEAFRRLGLTGRIVFAGDLLAMFASVGLATQGYCIVAGTGAGVIRVRDGEIDRVVDLAGWQLGDLGSGYWLGHEAAKAAVADMEGRGEATALTAALLAALGITADAQDRAQGRPLALRQFIDAVYALRPIELARFAPLVVAHRDDTVAAQLIGQAEAYLLHDFRTAFDPNISGPVALGGGVIPHLKGIEVGVAAIVREAGQVPDIRAVVDGSVGAIILAFRATGRPVTEALFQRVVAAVATQREGLAPG